MGVHGKEPLEIKRIAMIEMIKRTAALNMRKIVTIGFNKEEDGIWYVDFPEYTGSHADLMMVSGADIMLDRLAEGEKHVDVQVCLREFEDCIEVVKKTNEDVDADYGRDYWVEKMDLFIWLCPVMLYTFGGYYPKQFYIKKEL